MDDDGRIRPGGRGNGHGLSTSTGAVAGFSIHARHAIRAGDKEGRERLARYAARPPFADAQLSETADGRIAVELGTKRRSGGTHVVLEPLALIRRIAWMIPPPKRHAMIYRGVLAPAAKWRAEIVPIQVKTAVSPEIIAPVAPAGVEIRSTTAALHGRALSLRVAA